MYSGFWGKLKRPSVEQGSTEASRPNVEPFFVLAPLADVTDSAFRALIAKYGKPDVFYTEFVSADGLMHPKAREKLLKDFEYGENEHPIVAQIFGSRPENIEGAARLAKNLGFDGIDINMGCPDKAIEKQGAGAAHIKNPAHAKEIIRAAKRGADGLPVSVKTRVGYNSIELETWFPTLLEEDIAVLTVHARTRKEMSLVPARWEHVARAVEIRNSLGKETLIVGNGDARDIPHARELVTNTGCDGAMLGRAIFGNPWLFAEHAPKTEEKLRVMCEHTKLFEDKLSGHKNFAVMKKHYKAYVNGFDGAKELRMKLMDAQDAKEVEKITSTFLFPK